MITKGTVVFIIFLLLLSIFTSNLLNLLKIPDDDALENEETSNFTDRLVTKYVKIADSPKNLIWFLQISDIHISIFRDAARISHFQQFCDKTVKIIQPLLVLASGDLTDAKEKNNLGSRQWKTEWIYYHNIVKESGVTDYSVWLDIRGNHDNFNIKSINDKENYFREYSIQGPHNPKSYAHYEDKNGVKVAFIGVDACHEPGLRRPFNFIGLIPPSEQEHLRNLQLEASNKTDHVIWFGHYPTSCILPMHDPKNNFNLRNLIGQVQQSQVYVCGHLHSMGGLVPEMYTRQKSGFLELELSDWKDNRMFRLAAIDHGMISFTDLKHNEWPVVLVTNPKHAKFLMQDREPLRLIAESSFVRILAFSDAEIKKVEISFDNRNWEECVNVEGPLYTVAWDPKTFSKGLHTMYVSVVDVEEKQAQIEHKFSLDGTDMQFEIFPRLFLMLDGRVVFQMIFSLFLLLNTVPLALLRLCRRPVHFRNRRLQKVVNNLWLLSKTDRIFYPLILYGLYLPIGPWAIGEFVDGHVGVIFAWGIIISGTFLPEPFTYMYGSVQMFLVQIPLTYILAQYLDRTLYGLHSRGLKYFYKHLPFILLLSVQMLLAYLFWLEYGTLSFLLGPLKTWSIVLSILLWYKTLTIPQPLKRKLQKLNDVAMSS